jgi:hypothetical protein
MTRGRYEQQSPRSIRYALLMGGNSSLVINHPMTAPKMFTSKPSSQPTVTPA